MAMRPKSKLRLKETPAVAATAFEDRQQQQFAQNVRERLEKIEASLAEILTWGARVSALETAGPAEAPSSGGGEPGDATELTQRLDMLEQLIGALRAPAGIEDRIRALETAASISLAR